MGLPTLKDSTRGSTRRKDGRYLQERPARDCCDAHMTMRYKLLGRTGLRVSELCLGAMTFGDEWG